MKTIAGFFAVLLVGAVCAEVKAGGSPPVCMVVDKLVFEPNETTPTAVQIWGTFVFLQDNMSAYGPPRRGYLYYSIVTGQEAKCRSEWAELKKLAGAKQTISYGTCNQPQVSDHFRKPTAKPHAPDLFPVLKIGGFARAEEFVDAKMLKALVAASRQSSADKAAGKK